MKTYVSGLRWAMAMLAVAMVILAAGFGFDAQAAKKTHTLKGVVVAIEPTMLTLDDGKGGEVAIYTRQDYTEWVAVGMQVTASYHEQEGILKLDELEYPLEVSEVAPERFLPQIKKVILLPSSNAGDARPLFDRIEHLFQQRFDWVVAPRMLAEEIRRRDREARSVNTAVAPPEGGSIPALLIPADPELIQRIAEGSRADAVLEARVEYAQLPVNSHTAEWDGQRETYGSKSARFAAAFTRRPVRGRVPVATVVLNLFDEQGRLLWRRRHGFCVLALQTSMGNEFRDRPLTEAVEDSDFMNDWLSQVFATWLNAEPKPAGATALR